MSHSSSFEQDSTKAPLWLLVVGMVLFVAIASLAVLCPQGARPGAAPPAAAPADPPRPRPAGG
jgi:hypothetical protein